MDKAIFSSVQRLSWALRWAQNFQKSGWNITENDWNTLETLSSIPYDGVSKAFCICFGISRRFRYWDMAKLGVSCNLFYLSLKFFWQICSKGLYRKEWISFCLGAAFEGYYFCQNVSGLALSLIPLEFMPCGWHKA